MAVLIRIFGINRTKIIRFCVTLAVFGMKTNLARRLLSDDPVGCGVFVVMVVAIRRQRRLPEPLVERQSAGGGELRDPVDRGLPVGS